MKAQEGNKTSLLGSVAFLSDKTPNSDQNPSRSTSTFESYLFLFFSLTDYYPQTVSVFLIKACSGGNSGRSPLERVAISSLFPHRTQLSMYMFFSCFDKHLQRWILLAGILHR